MRYIACFFVIFFGFWFGTSVVDASGSSQLIIINKRTNQLAFYDNGNLVRIFKVATGRSDALTPEGTFQIVNKIKNRPYYKEGIRGGDPKNPLGDRWLGLNARGTYGTTYAIHGNANPASIGTYASSGCVRMYDEEVRWLFEQIDLFATVYITNTSKSFEAIAASKDYMTYSKLKSVTVNKESPQPENTSIKVTANKDGSVDSLYKFLVHDGTEWVTVQDFSHSRTLEWTPAKDGPYRIKAQIKSTVSDKAFDDEKEIPFDIFIPAKIVATKSDHEGPLPKDSSITFSTETNNHSNNHLQYSVFDGTEWEVLQPYSDSTKFTWKPMKPGDYTVKVQARHKLSNGDADEEKELHFTIYEPAELTTVATDKDSPQRLSSSITIVGVSNNDDGNLFKVSVFDGETWTILQDYKRGPIVTWNPSTTGEYKLKIQVKHKLSNADFDSELVTDYIIFEPATLHSFQLNGKGIQKANHPFSLLVSTDRQPGIEYRFSVFDGSTWNELQAYSTERKLNWLPDKSGFYKIKIEAKHPLSGQEFDDSKEIPVLVYNSTLLMIPAVLAPRTRKKMKDVLNIKGLPRRSNRKKNR